jgi:hypothetical protein
VIHTSLVEIDEFRLEKKYSPLLAGSQVAKTPSNAKLFCVSAKAVIQRTAMELKHAAAILGRSLRPRVSNLDQVQLD